ncbi:DUF500-domain-containing protein [Ceraceosorus guamensis]|uniref:DUF500-domain-containing protein n=1 Tax=Ceraceosorus guamensis TaxID=1522189 RepID=A0A316VZG9_9BASI|nr:DUF500-domain-containing protein [Ceraceosorus guamensis]PWN40885.1 DUF500-domain-containing protein [Ceraceosorus guamensis]
MGNPLPVSLPEECIKAQKILRRMVDPVHGVDGVVPLKVLEKAKGFAIFSVFRVGFLMSARGGSGIVIARTGPNSWSAPAALAIGGLGGGFNAGADVTDFLIVLNTARAVKAFMSTGSLQLGGNLSVAVGPVGRSAEAAAAVNSEGSAAAMYSYSRSKGVYAGLSVEGTVLLDRSDANSKAYHQSDCSAKKVLSGSVDVPSWALPLHDTVKKFTMTGGADDARSVKDHGGWVGTTGAIEGMSGDPYAEERAENERRRNNVSSTSRDWDEDERGGAHSRWATDESTIDVDTARQKALERGMRDLDAGHRPYSPNANFASGAFPSSSRAHIDSTATTSTAASPTQQRRVVALYDFEGQEAQDLSFKIGDVIRVIRATMDRQDWWLGRLEDASAGVQGRSGVVGR